MNLFKKVIGIFSLKNSLYDLGIDSTPSERMRAEIARWERIYRDGGAMSVASAVASETARLVTLELRSEITGSERAEYLNEQYGQVLKNIRGIAETACACGGVVLKPYVEDGKIRVSCIRAENFVPTEFTSSGEITGAVFSDRIFSDGKTYTRVERHSFDGGNYKIQNSVFVSDNPEVLGRKTAFSAVERWRDIEREVCISGVDKPLFAYFKMPMANFVDSASPLGVSVFARACPLIEDAEKQYGRLLWEFESGERAVYVDESAMRHDRNGNSIIPDRRLYRLLNSGDDTLFKDWTPELREESIINGLNEILRRIEFNSGLAYGTLSRVSDTDRTAEEIRASKQRSYAHVCDIQAALRTALISLAEAMNTLADLYGLAPEGEYETVFEFDDSIIADRKCEFEEKLRLFEAGIMSAGEMRVWYFGEDEETAERRLCVPAHGMPENKQAERTVKL